jgi:hypothetical protein
VLLYHYRKNLRAIVGGRGGPLRLHVVGLGRRSGAHKRPRYPEDACCPLVRGGSRARCVLRGLAV